MLARIDIAVNFASDDELFVGRDDNHLDSGVVGTDDAFCSANNFRIAISVDLHTKPFEAGAYCSTQFGIILPHTCGK